jgi:hypothetical protein
MSAISERWIGVPVAVEPPVLAALVVALLALDAAVALEELLLELPHPAAISAAMANVSDNAFSLMSPLLVCIDPLLGSNCEEGYHSIRQPDVKFGSGTGWSTGT